MDNVFVERLWRSMKYEEVYLNAYASVAEAKAGIGAWIGFYNEERQPTGLFFLADEGQDEGAAVRRGAVLEEAIARDPHYGPALALAALWCSAPCRPC
jgi:hypothetical protein